ncbi:MAG TPA: hypothetical protein VLH35_04220, partial [Candidatus Acidoferrales bacterium]|nr:hypothetical protein [Candidatus Acidoferrales bacterium]
MTELIDFCCPSCGSLKAFKDGTRQLSNGEKAQRYICRVCAYRYTFPPSLKAAKDNSTDNQICTPETVKNLVESTTEEVVGDNAKVNQFIEWMRTEGY